jgi:hypothetical protein
MILEALGDEWCVVDIATIRPDHPSVLLPDVPDLRYIGRSLEILSTEFHLNASIRTRIASQVIGVDVGEIYGKDGQILGSRRWPDELLPCGMWAVSHSLEGRTGSCLLEEKHQKRDDWISMLEYLPNIPEGVETARR